MIKKRTAAIIAVILIVLTAGFSSFLTLQIGRFIDIEKGNRIVISKEDYFVNRDFYQKFNTVLNDIQENYLYETEPDVLLDGAIKGMVDSVADDYTWYKNPEEYLEWAQAQASNYEGIGLQVQAREEDNSITVVRVYEGGPAAEAGVAVGDKLIAVEGEPCNAETMDEAISKVKGEAGTPVNVTFLRDEDAIDFEIVRAVVQMPELEYELLDNNIGYIWLYDFDGNPGDKFIEAVEKLKHQGMEGLILDIRWNPGGRLDQYLKIGDYLLPEGLLITEVNRDGEIMDERKSDADSFDLPLVVLCNNYTASAGDLLTAAVQDYATGLIVGETTFGKGIVQTIKHYPEDGSLLYFTTAEYLTPNGRKIHGIGVTPDIEVTLGEEAEKWMQENPGKELPKELDQQLQTGISEIKKQLQEEPKEE